MDYKAEFIRIFSENVSRPGAQQLLDWLATTDFYTAPASTRFHGACECGLVMHSINVYNVLMSRFYTEEDNKESFTLVSLLHDLCKANYYKSGFRNVKNDATGQWEKVPSYSVQDAFPFGHGEKSVYLIERFIRLKPVEAIAIRCTWRLRRRGARRQLRHQQCVRRIPAGCQASSGRPGGHLPGREGHQARQPPLSPVAL